MRLVVSLLTAVCFVAAAARKKIRVQEWRVQLLPRTLSRAFGTGAQHHRHHQAVVAASSEAGRQTTTCQWIGRLQFRNTHCL
jgi:hypothetical protein